MKALLSILALALLGSCVTYQRCTDKFGVYGIDTVKVPYEVPITVTVLVPADSTQVALAIDSLFRLQKDTIYTFKSDSSNLVISYWIDRLRRLQIKANQPPLIIRKDSIIKGETIYLPPKLVDKPNKLQRFWNEYKFYSAIILPLVLLFAWFFKK